MKAEKKNEKQTIVIYTDGAGCRPDGKGSGFAWVRLDTGVKTRIREDGLTNNQAEYRGIKAALESVDENSTVEIRSDAENVCCQLKGERRTLDQNLVRLRDQILEISEKHNLSVSFIWVPRNENLAGKFL
jgi:ribonuclease HI